MIKIVSQKEYWKDLKEFTEKHGGVKIETSSIANNDIWTKTYYSDDKAFFYEYHSIFIDDIEFTYHGQQHKTTTKFYATEYYSTDHPESKYVFECI